MIVYNVNRRWFTMKADAEAYRKAEGLPPSATFKLDIFDRLDLAELLNGLCGATATPPLTMSQFATVGDLQDAKRHQAMIERNRVVDNPPDFVPAFLVRDWQARHKIKGDDA